MVTSLFTSHNKWSGRVPYLAVIFIFIGAAIVFYAPTITLLPRGIHEWAQADRLALALSFYDFGLDFFHPRTFSLLSIDGVTGVELPVQAYLAALLGHVFGRQNIYIIFRCITIGFSLAGGYYLFRIVYEHTKSFMAALLPFFFLLASPVFAYYSGNYLPDTASVSLVFIGMYYAQRFLLSDKSFKNIALSLLFLALATLIKTSSIIYLGAIIGALLLTTYLNTNLLDFKSKLYFILSIIVSIILVVMYILYTKYVNDKYNSLAFLAEVRPIETAEMRQYIWERIDTIWRYEYFSKFSYNALVFALLVILVYTFLNIRQLAGYYSILIFIGISLIGGLLFFEMMGSQFIDHDYYVIAPYMPLVITAIMLAVIMSSVYLGRIKWLQYLWLPVLVLFGFLGYKNYRARTAESYKTFSPYYRYQWMQGGAASLAENEVAKDSRILVLAEGAPNLSLVYFDRRGIVWGQNAAEVSPQDVQQKMAAYGLTYLVMSRENFDRFLPGHRSFVAASRQIALTTSFVVLQPNITSTHW